MEKIEDECFTIYRSSNAFTNQLAISPYWTCITGPPEIKSTTLCLSLKQMKIVALELYHFNLEAFGK